MDILHAALSLAPYRADGPAAGALSGLCRALRTLGHDVGVVVPYDPAYQEAGLLAARRLTPIRLADGTQANVLEAQLPSGLALTLIDLGGALLDPWVPERNLGPEGARSYARFAEAVALLIRERVEEGRGPEVVHAHDCEAGMVILALERAGLAAVPSVLTVHDAQRSGKCDVALREALGIPEELATAHAFASGEQLCVLKGLLGLADQVVVPSSAYARSLCAPERHGALSRAFHAASPLGIFDGVDVAIYNPATDSALEARFDAADPAPKGINKAEIQRRYELNIGATHPLLLVPSGAQVEASMATVLSALPAMMRLDFQVVLAGFGPADAKTRELLEPFVGQVRVLDTPDEPTTRRLLSAADFFLSVRRSDPTGLEVRQAARYGAVPIALDVDATSDVIVDCDASLATGTGFLIDAVTQRSIIAGLGRAATAFRSAEFERLRKRVMRQDASWDRPSRQYAQVYRRLSSPQAGFSADA